MVVNDLSIIIPTKDRGTIFTKTLNAAYLAIQDISAEIIIINDSKTNVLKLDNIYEGKITVIQNPKSGVASARNLGAKLAKYNNLLFLDDDILISKSNISSLLIISNQYPNAAINFNWIYPKDLIDRIQKTKFGRYLINIGYTSLKGWNQGLKWDADKPFEIELIASYFLFIKKSNFTLIGGYNEDFPHAGAEDYEFAMRLKKTNVVGLCNPESTVLHNEEDRVCLQNWLKRKEKSAETRKVAVNLGYKEMSITTSKFKILCAYIIYSFRWVFFLFLKLLPNKKPFDFVYAKIVNFLLAAHLYKGYFK